MRTRVFVVLDFLISTYVFAACRDTSVSVHRSTATTFSWNSTCGSQGLSVNNPFCKQFEEQELSSENIFDKK